MKKLTRNVALTAMVLMMSLVFIQCKDSVVNKFIELQVEQENKSCPVKMAGGMTLDKSEATGNKTIKYYYTVPDAIAKKLTFDDATKAETIDALKSQPQFKQIKELSVSYIYAYYDTNKNLLGEIKITPEDYK